MRRARLQPIPPISKEMKFTIQEKKSVNLIVPSQLVLSKWRLRVRYLSQIQLLTNKMETYLSVEFHTRFLVATHELRIPPGILSNTCLNPLNPKFGPFTSFPTTISIGVLPWFLQATNRDAKTIFRTTSKTLGVFEYVFMLSSFLFLFFGSGIEMYFEKRLNG